MAGVNVRNIASGQISATDVVMLASAITSKKVPLALNVNIGVKNPTDRNALLTTMDWALDIAAKEFATGSTNQNYNINAKKTTTVPLGVSTDLYQLFSSTGVEALKTFASSFSKDGTSSQLGLRVRPAISVAGQTIKSPSYIQIMSPSTSSTTSSTSTSTPSTTGKGSKKSKSPGVGL